MSRLYKPKAHILIPSGPVDFDPAEIMGMDPQRATDLLAGRPTQIVCRCEGMPGSVLEPIGDHRYRCQHGEIYEFGNVVGVQIVLELAPLTDPLTPPG